MPTEEKTIHISTFVIDYDELDQLADIGRKNPTSCIVTEPLIDVMRVYLCDEEIDLGQAQFIMEVMLELELEDLEMDMPLDMYEMVRQVR